ncbi:hypothetical protein AB832_05315, partial [Flavobacteriaceae bacterium (ex Bugula neritina AB1)]
MKKLITVIIVAVIASASVFANDKSIGETAQQKLRKEIIELLERPHFKIEKSSIEAEIEFTLNAKNEIVILTVNSDKDIVENYVKSKLNYKKVNS